MDEPPLFSKELDELLPPEEPRRPPPAPAPSPQRASGNTRFDDDARRSAGTRDMFIGGLVFAIGSAITAVTYLMAAEEGEGKFVLAWGAIVFGAIQFIRGLIRVNSD